MTHGERPRGSFVVLIGPDGVGKTTLAERLLSRRPTARYFHFCPPLRWRPDQPIPGEVRQRTTDERGSRILGWVRISRNAVRFWLGYLATVRPAVRRGELVIGDRWAYGYVAKPEALRFHGPSALAEIVVRALPKPDLVVVLTAAPEVIVRRKPELTLGEAAAEVASWAAIPAARVVVLDAEQDPNILADRVLGELRWTDDRSANVDGPVS